LKLNNPQLLLTVAKGLVKTLRVEVEFLSPPKFPSIVAFWHVRMFLLPFALREYAPKVAILISRHRDGELIAQVVEKLGFKTVRGSTGPGKGGEKAFLEMLRLLEKGYVVAITPDGPRGPREVVKPGIAKLALKSGLPVYPLTFSAKNSFKLNSWDKFLIPYPFSKCKVILGEPIKPESFMNHNSEDELRKAIELKLKQLTEKADREVLWKK
jgi:lysophospholipid acyltransferase (LPLAT)-like uncharacterized protein